MNIQNVTVAGSGVLGYQIACQCALHGFKVTVYDINDEVLEKAKAKFTGLAEAYKRDLNKTDQDIEATFNNLTYQSNLAEAVKDADLVIEAVPENPEIKIDFYTKLRQVAPEKTIFATNSSTMLPSQFAQYTGRPENFLALHFANNIWTSNTAEIMGHDGTDKAIFDQIVQFSKDIGMIALPLYKEQPGYILNTLLVPFVSSAMELYAKEVADPQTIDKTWMKATGSPIGPFGILDIVGPNTAYNITMISVQQTQDPLAIKVAELLKTQLIDQGKLGVQTGQGFYSYPNPAYLEDDFLS